MVRQPLQSLRKISIFNRRYKFAECTKVFVKLFLLVFIVLLRGEVIKFFKVFLGYIRTAEAPQLGSELAVRAEAAS